MSADVAAAAERITDRIAKDLQARGVQDAPGRARALVGPVIPKVRAMRDSAQPSDAVGQNPVPTFEHRMEYEVPTDLLVQAQVELDQLQRRGRSATVAGYRDTPFSRSFWESLK